MRYEEMLERLDEADTLILSVFYKLKQESDEKAISMLLFDANVKILNAIELLDEKVS